MDAAAEKVELTREEYEELLKGAPKQTITVDAAEYAAMAGIKPAYDKLRGEHDRAMTRLRELEACLRREQREHQEEIEAALQKIKKLGG